MQFRPTRISKFPKDRKYNLQGIHLKSNQKKGNMTTYLIKSKNNIILTENQILSNYNTLNKILRKYLNTRNKYKVKLCIFPHIALTSKPKEVRMGGGKGKITTWGCLIKAGQPLFKFSYFNSDINLSEMEQEIFKNINQKLNIKIIQIRF